MEVLANGFRECPGELSTQGSTSRCWRLFDVPADVLETRKLGGGEGGDIEKEGGWYFNAADRPRKLIGKYQFLCEGI